MTYLLVIANKNYSSWSMRIWTLMTHFNIPFEEKVLVFQSSGDKRQAEYLKFSPHGKLPCLHHTDNDGDNNNNNNENDNDNRKPLVVWDSLAIVEYLAEVEPSRALWPPPSSAAARAFARCAASEMHSGFTALRDEMSQNLGLRIELLLRREDEDEGEGEGEDGGNESASFSASASASGALLEDLRRLDELWCEGLRRFGGPFLAGGEFCAADAFFVPVAGRLRTFGVEAWVSGPAREYAARLLALPAVQQWVEAALREPFRNEWKEKDCIRGRKVLEDLRTTT